RDLVQLVKIGVQSRGMGRYMKSVVCFFLCPDADCSRNNLFICPLQVNYSEVLLRPPWKRPFSLVSGSFSLIQRQHPLSLPFPLQIKLHLFG
uniref:hypothetical protein n=1 Tax=Enterocloster clostridioformis TaxID=1531 RepID=UPI003AB914BE